MCHEAWRKETHFHLTEVFFYCKYIFYIASSFTILIYITFYYFICPIFPSNWIVQLIPSNAVNIFVARYPSFPPSRKRNKKKKNACLPAVMFLLLKKKCIIDNTCEKDQQYVRRYNSLHLLTHSMKFLKTRIIKP